jgi:hypothetical protein
VLKAFFIGIGYLVMWTATLLVSFYSCVTLPDVIVAPEPIAGIIKETCLLAASAMMIWLCWRISRFSKRPTSLIHLWLGLLAFAITMAGVGLSLHSGPSQLGLLAVLISITTGLVLQHWRIGHGG